MVVYPTYEGICSDIEAIAKIVHDHNIPLLVDEAHGAHLGFHPDLPITALTAGADLTVQSTHKVLGAMTQAAMLHVQGNRVNRDRVSRALQLLQSTSPNYLLLASLDAARQQMALQGLSILEHTLDLAQFARHQIPAIPHLSVLELPASNATPAFMALDPTRLTVLVQSLGLDGFAIDEQLHQSFGVTAELPTLTHLTFALSLGNTPLDIERLIRALQQVAKTCNTRVKFNALPYPSFSQGDSIGVPVVTPRQAHLGQQEKVPWSQAAYRISAEWVCPYPPASPHSFLER